MITESDGCALLEKSFKKRGYAVARNVDFHEGGVHCELDGWDATQRVGFEYLVRAEGDHDDLTSAEQAELADRIERGDLYVLIVDEVTDADVLRFAATHFLDEVEHRRGVSRKPPATSRATAPKNKAPKKKASKKKAPKKKAPKKKAPKKKAPKKKAPKKKAPKKKAPKKKAPRKNVKTSRKKARR